MMDADGQSFWYLHTAGQAPALPIRIHPLTLTGQSRLNVERHMLSGINDQHDQGDGRRQPVDEDQSFRRRFGAQMEREQHKTAKRRGNEDGNDQCK
jgi:hypothetical protein